MCRKTLPLIFFMLAGLVLISGARADAIDDNNICYAQFSKGNNKDAIEYCSRAIDSGELEDADLVAALINRGVALRAEQNPNGAVADYTHALEYAPEDALIYANRANALRDLGRLDEALADADKAIELDPQRGAAFYTRGAIYDAQGMKNEARRDYLQALALDPENRTYKKILLGE